MFTEEVPKEFVRALQELGLSNSSALQGRPLTGGVSSDIWCIETENGLVCAKRALPKLRVAADWRAPIERNLYEARWLQVAHVASAGCAPELLGQHAELGVLAMRYLPPADFQLWKNELHAGHVDTTVAKKLGDILSSIHNALVEQTQQNAKTLVHGDVSPKNILLGKHGPVLLDAECATWSDPAFDLAFCLNHLLLKCLWTPSSSSDFLHSFGVLAKSYLLAVDWENSDELEARAARLLPGLLLARVDGKSPVEYITQDKQKDMVRKIASALLLNPPTQLQHIAHAWAKELAA